MDSIPFDPERPDLLPGLTETIESGTPPAIDLFPYIAIYDVRCAFCGHHQMHRRGYVVETGDGRRALCGIHCAAKHLGVEVIARMQSGISALERRIARQRILAPVLEGTPAVLAQILAWEPIERKIDAAASALCIATSGIYLCRFVTDGGTIDRDETEIFDEPFTRRDGTTGTRKGQRRRLLGRRHRLDGGRALRPRRHAAARRGRRRDRPAGGRLPPDGRALRRHHDDRRLPRRPHWDNIREDHLTEETRRAAAKRIMMLPIPDRDPVTGAAMREWIEAPSSVDADLNDFRDQLDPV